MVNRYIGEVDAPEFGEGYTIRLDIAGQAELETEFGAFEFAWRVTQGLAIMSSAHLTAFLKVALRKDGERVKEVPEFAPLEPVARHCLDAFALFRYGKDHETWVAENAAETDRKAGNANANPTRGTKASRSG